jgi:rhamnose transport system permease protein
VASNTNGPQVALPPSPRPAAGPASLAVRVRPLLRWETALVGVLLLTIWYGVWASPNFGTPTDVFFIGLNVGEIAIMALPVALIVITGEIDLSVASMLGLSSTLLGYLFERGWPISQAIVFALVVGAIGGALNGLLVTRLGLPSIAVTIGTLTLFRGIAEIILGAGAVTGFPIALTNIGIFPVPGTHIAYSTAIFIVMAVIFAVVLHGTTVGRAIFAIGLQKEAAFFSGIRVNRIKFWLFVLSGAISAFAGILWTFRFSTSRYDAGLGLELSVVAIVLLGGISIFGGRGSILGVVLGATVLACLRDALTLINVSGEVQNIVTGGLLLVIVVVPNAPEALRRLRNAMRSRSDEPGVVAPAPPEATAETSPVPPSVTAR